MKKECYQLKEEKGLIMGQQKLWHMEVLAQSTQTYKKFYKIHNILSSLREIHWLKKLQ